MWFFTPFFPVEEGELLILKKRTAKTFATLELGEFVVHASDGFSRVGHHIGDAFADSEAVLFAFVL